MKIKNRINSTNLKFTYHYRDIEDIDIRINKFINSLLILDNNVKFIQYYNISL